MAGFQKLLLHTLISYLIHLVQGDEHLVHGLLRKTAVQGHATQDTSVVDTDRKTVVRADSSKGSGGSQNQLNFSQAGGISQDINVTLYKLAETALLGTVCTPHTAHLKGLEGAWQIGCVIGVIAGKGEGEVIAQAAVHQVILFL